MAVPKIEAAHILLRTILALEPALYLETGSLKGRDLYASETGSVLI